MAIESFDWNKHKGLVRLNTVEGFVQDTFSWSRLSPSATLTTIQNSHSLQRPLELTDGELERKLRSGLNLNVNVGEKKASAQK